MIDVPMGWLEVTCTVLPGETPKKETLAVAPPVIHARMANEKEATTLDVPLKDVPWPDKPAVATIPARHGQCEVWATYGLVKSGPQTVQINNGGVTPVEFRFGRE